LNWVGDAPGMLVMKRSEFLLRVIAGGHLTRSGNAAHSFQK